MLSGSSLLCSALYKFDLDDFMRLLDDFPGVMKAAPLDLKYATDQERAPQGYIGRHSCPIDGHKSTIASCNPKDYTSPERTFLIAT